MTSRPLLSVIIPVYNESSTLDQVIRRVRATEHAMQVIIVDDGSTDGSAEIATAWQQRGLVTSLRHEVNRGKGAAIRTGLTRAHGRFTIVQDADLEYDPQDYARLLAPLVSGQAQIVYGSRFGGTPPSPSGARLLLNGGIGLLNRAAWALYGVRLADEATGYKAFQTELLFRMDLKSERFEFCSEVTAKACRMGIPIIEVPIRYCPRGRSEGKKLRLWDGLPALHALWRWRHWFPMPDEAPTTLHEPMPGDGYHSERSRY